jgi:hypothetical protein
MSEPQAIPKCYGIEAHYSACALSHSLDCAFIDSCKQHVEKEKHPDCFGNKEVLLYTDYCKQFNCGSYAQCTEQVLGNNAAEYRDSKRKQATPDDRQVGGTHYKDMPVQPWELMETILTPEEFIGFLKGTLIKYAMRAGKKSGSDDVSKYEHCKAKLDEVLSKTCYHF